MGIFDQPEQSEQKQPMSTPEQNPQSGVDQALLQQLGLTEENLKHGDNLKKLFSQGEAYYELFPRLKMRAFSIGTNINLVSPPGERTQIPRHAEKTFIEWSKNKPAEVIEPVWEEVRAYLNGWGNKALENKDWQTAVETFEITTQGGITENHEVMDRLAQLSQEDKTIGREIYEAIKARKDARAVSSAGQASNQPTILKPRLEFGEAPQGSAQANQSPGPVPTDL